ncbi:MAG: type II secretion system minor pseudopilin GspH [Rudaea sp.]
MNRVGRTRGIASITGPRASRGFTLMEILVVLVILAVLTAAVSLAVAGAGGERVLTREAERAQALIAYACERAELSGLDIGLSFDRGGYRFSHLDHDVWAPYRGDELRPRSWPANLSAALTHDGQAVALAAQFPDKPQLLCYASGELTPFRIELALPDLDRRYRLDGTADGQVALATVDVRAR